MLKLLRKKGVAKKVIWFVAIIIIISFGFLGTAYLITDYASAGYAGKIFGKRISYEDYNTAYNHVRIQALMRYGESFYKIQNNLNLDAETWDRLILAYKADRNKIKVPDEEVVDAIESYPFFQRDGQFDSSLYDDVVSFVFRTDPIKYENGVRETLRLQKLLETQAEDVTIDEQTLFDEYKKRNERVQIDYVAFFADQYTQEAVFTEDELKEFFRQNKAEFIVPESINASYLFFPKPDKKIFEKAKIPVPSPEPADPAATPLEQPVMELDEEAYKAAVAAAKANVEEIHKAFLINPNIEEISQQFGAEVKATGFISQQKPNLSSGLPFRFMSQLFNLDLKEVSQLFDNDNGFYIAQITEKKDSYVPEYDEAKPQVETQLRLKKAEDIAKARAEEALQSINQVLSSDSTKTFETAAADLGLTIEQTPQFNRGQYLPKIGLAQEFQDAAFALSNTNQLSAVTAIPKGHSILHLAEYVPVNDEQFAEGKATLEEELLNQKKTEVYTDYLAQLRVEAEIVDNIAKAKENSQATQ